jgi:hypothetical protein
MDARLLAPILMRGLVREGRPFAFALRELPDVPGALPPSGVVGKHAGNIVEVHHQRLFHDTLGQARRFPRRRRRDPEPRHVEVLIAAPVAPASRRSCC